MEQHASHPVPSAAVVFGSGPAWAAALEGALFLKEVAMVPTEGCETREGATTAMFALGPGHLVLSLATRDDPLLDEAERVCSARGATVVRLPGGDQADRRLAPITALPAITAFAAALAITGGPRRRPSLVGGRVLPDGAPRHECRRRRGRARLRVLGPVHVAARAPRCRR